MLSLNLTRIRTAREAFAHVYEPGEVSEDDDLYRVKAPVDLAFDIFKDKDQFRLIGRVRTTLELPCSRCLESTTSPVDAAFDLRYQPAAASASPAEREIRDEDLSAATYEGDVIDLRELMREQVYLALPMKPLCRDDCRGLCPQCGTNLNRGACACTGGWEDPRFAVLKTLKHES